MIVQKWYTKEGPHSDIALSSRVRLARNIEGVPFPIRMTRAQKQEVNSQIRAALLEAPSPIAKEFEYIDLEICPLREIYAMVERHLISPEFAQNREGRALLLTRDESVSIMLCEEDHLRIQVMRPGFNLEDAFAEADRLDTLLGERLSYAFDDRLGYLTQCPTNLGTGMRASVMLHLAAMQNRRLIGQFAATVAKLGLTIRGTYGEGSEPKGAIYQLSNQVTLGISELAALDNLSAIAMQVVERERAAEAPYKGDAQLTDKIFRAYGLLQSARLIDGEEFMHLISLVRLGAALGILHGISLGTINELIFSAGSASIMARAGKELGAVERDAARAEWIREKLSMQ